MDILKSYMALYATKAELNNSHKQLIKNALTISQQKKYSAVVEGHQQLHKFFFFGQTMTGLSQPKKKRKILRRDNFSTPTNEVIPNVRRNLVGPKSPNEPAMHNKVLHFPFYYPHYLGSWATFKMHLCI